MWFDSNGLLYNEKLQELGIKHFITTKLLGDMSDENLRMNLLKSQKINPEKLVTAEQIHSNKVYFATTKDIGKKIPGADALITETLEIPIGIFTADCVPVFIVEEKGRERGSEGRRIGLVHAGWRGIKSGIIESVLSFFNNPIVVLGPHICKNCYSIDLEAEIISTLKTKHISEGNIYLPDINKFCTYHNPELFYSYHRGDKTNRMLSIIFN